MSFELRRGVNISHWLSQSDRRGEERRSWFTRDDVERLAGCGFDHLRFPVDEVQLWDDDLNREGEAFELLGRGLDWCEQAGLRAIVDLHIVRSHYFNVDSNALFADPAEQDKLCALWADLSNALEHRPVDRVCYELLNEPKAPADEDWNELAARVLAEIRRGEPDRVVAVDGNRVADPRGFSTLRVPDDRSLILTFHFYDPIVFTHYRAFWSAVKAYEGPIDYPGELVAQEDWDALPEQARLEGRGVRTFTPEDIERLLEAPLALAAKTGLPLWCGEFGALPTTPGPARGRWYRDVLGALEHHSIGWTIWDYKGDFGVFDREGEPTAALGFLNESGALG
jgi:endoglucanase